jgi:diguanylate cyclase (GGDEF)-like protein
MPPAPLSALPVTRRGAAHVAPLRRLAALCVLLLALPCAAATDVELRKRAHEIEANLMAFPKQSLAELESLAPQARGAEATTRRFIDALRGEAMVQSGRKDSALEYADKLESEGLAAQDPVRSAIALLVRGAVQSWAGDASRAYALASEARNLVKATDDGYVRFWAAMSVGTSARLLGRSDEALSSLQDAFTLADSAQDHYRRAAALYQLSVLDLYLKQAEKAFDESVASFHESQLAGSPWGMARAKMAESATLEVLNKPKQELSTMQEALAIARNAKSDVLECYALINLSDIYLRRKDYKTTYELSERSLKLAQQSDDMSLIAVNKANMGFALFGLGRIDAGKRLAEEALAEYERRGAFAEIAGILGDFGQFLASAGDYKGALALRDRQQRVSDKIAFAVREKDVLEMQSKFESEKRIREIELLNREKNLQSIELQNRQWQDRIWWLLAAVFALSFAVVAFLYRKLRTTNTLLAQKNTELSFQSSRDPLTALYNRRHFQNFINEGRGETDRRRGAVEKPVQALLLIDLDHFKLINDQFGHAAGDAVLIAVARRLRDTLRETDMIVRWGGEEFLVFVPVAPADRLDEIVLRIMHAISVEPIQYMGHYIHVTVSIGYSPVLLPPDHVALGWERVIGLVDKALYMAKLHGRNRAYGVGGMLRSGDEALAAVDSDLEKAWRDGVVNLRVLVGAQAVDAAAQTVPTPGVLKH